MKFYTIFIFAFACFMAINTVDASIENLFEALGKAAQKSIISMLTSPLSDDSKDSKGSTTPKVMNRGSKN